MRPFPIKSNTKSHKSIIKSYSKEKNGERDTGAAAWEEQNNPRTRYKSRTNLIQVKGYLYPRRPVRPVPGTGQTGWSAYSPCTRSHLMDEILSSQRSLLHDAAILMKIWSAVLEGPRNPGRWPVLRKPPKLLAREDSRLHAVALYAVPASAF